MAWREPGCIMCIVEPQLQLLKSSQKSVFSSIISLFKMLVSNIAFFKKNILRAKLNAWGPDAAIRLSSRRSEPGWDALSLKLGVQLLGGPRTLKRLVTMCRA